MSKYILFILLIIASLFPYNVFADNVPLNSQKIQIIGINDNGGYFLNGNNNIQLSSKFEINGKSYAIGDEIIEKRTENSKTTYLGRAGNRDKFVSTVSIAPIHYKDNYNDNKEQWKDIDLTIINGRMDKAPYELIINLNNVFMRDKRTNSITTLTLGSIGDKSIILPQSLIEVGNKALAYNIATDTDLEIIATTTGIKYTRILKSDKAQVDCMFAVSQSGTGIILKSKAEDSNLSKTDKSIPVISELKNGILTETIDKSKVNLIYPVRIDPTLTISNASEDAFIYIMTPVSYNAANTATNGSSLDDSFYLMVGQEQGGIQWFIYRAYLVFNTSALPSGSSITNACLSLYISDGTDTEYDIVVQNGQPTYPHQPIVSTDFDKSQYSGDGGSINTAVLTDIFGTWNNITLNTAGKGYIQKGDGAVTKLALRSSLDISATPPGSGKQDRTQIASSTDSGLHYPKMYIEYTTSAVIDTITASSVSDTTAIMGGNVTSVGVGNVTQYGIQYGTNVSYGLWQNITEIKTSAFSFTNTTTGLTSGTTYYFRAFCNNTSDGMSYGLQLSFLTKPAAATAVSATDGTYSANVTVTWTKSTGATGYKVYEGANLLATLGDVDIYADTAAAAPTISIAGGLTTATDGTSSANVALNNAGEIGVVGASRTYKVVAFNSSGDASDSNTNDGYRGTSTLHYSWQVSAGDSDTTYSAIATSDTDPYNYTASTIDAGNYYKVIISMADATNVTTVADRGWKKASTPSIDTSTESSVTTTSARLNSNVISDGGAPTGVIVRFGYSNVSHSAAFADYGGANGTITSWSAANYTTGQLPFVDIAGLTTNTTYYFNVNALNSGGNAYGTELSFTTVLANVTTCPIYFSGVPSTNSIDLQWAKTGSLAYVKLYYQLSAIPSSNTTGTLIYSGADNYFQHTGLNSGTSYGYRIYGYESLTWSTNNATLMVTTLPSTANSTGIATPTAPGSMYITPSSSWLTNIPLHELADNVATSIQMPVGNFYLLAIVISGVIIGFIVYRKAKDELIALIAIIIIFGIGTTQGIVPLWLTIGTALLIIPIWAVRRRA